jgi:putative Mg2+ transporter-C (MgtC) family protein
MMDITGAGPAVAAGANSEGWLQAAELGLAFALSALVGLERELRRKHAGLRTHALVGTGAALFMLISKYGFTDVAVPRLVVLDPSRVAAQIVSGIGFLGAGLIVVRRDAVQGLTTAASIWVTAAIGAAAGAGLPALAALSCGIYLIIAFVFPVAARRLPPPPAAALRVRYLDGRGILRTLIAETTSRGFTITELTSGPAQSAEPAGHPMVQVTLHLHGTTPLTDLAVALSALAGVDAVLPAAIAGREPRSRRGQRAGPEPAWPAAGQAES